MAWSRQVLAILAIGALPWPALAEPPDVVVGIKPIHSLVAGVMRGVGEPTLLVDGAGSPHTYSLRPSEARAIAQADVVFWVGKGLETFLATPLATLAPDASLVALGAAPGVALLPTRSGGLWQEHDEDDVDHAEEEAHGASDMHVWLDPQNAKSMVGIIATTLAGSDPENAGAYEANAASLREELDRLDRRVAKTLASVVDRPFVVFHDGYQYFEKRYGLNAIGSISVGPDRRPGARRLQEIRAMLEKTDAACVFAEPQFEPALVATVIEDTPARAGMLDPLGAELDAGPEQYLRLVEGLAGSLVDCLGAARSG